MEGTLIIPSKLFECMGMGIPILHGVAGESAEIVRRMDAGLVFEPENSHELIGTLLQLKNNPTLYQRLSANGLAGAKCFDRAELAGRMLEILLSLIRRRS